MCKEALNTTIVGGRFGLSIQRIGKLGEVDRGQRDERQNEGRSECDAGFMPGQNTVASRRVID